MSKIGQNAISLDRLERLLANAKRQGKKEYHGYRNAPTADSARADSLQAREVL